MRDGAGPAPSLDRIASGADAVPFALSTLDRRVRRDVLFALGRFLRAMHDADVAHRDLKAPNLVASRDDGRVSFSIVDLEGARISRRDLGWRRRARDLGRLDASIVPGAITNADRFRVLDGYCAPYRRMDVDRRTFAAKVRAASARKRKPATVKP